MLIALCLILGTLAGANAETQPSATVDEPRVEAACDLVLSILKEVPGASVERKVSEERPCVIELEGTFTALEAGNPPHDRLSGQLEKQGWQYDHDYSADGPDGTAFRMHKRGEFCQVRGSWDGGDCSDSTHVPGDWYRLSVECNEMSEASSDRSSGSATNTRGEKSK